jgi:hypothetical protein
MAKSREELKLNGVLISDLKREELEEIFFTLYELIEFEIEERKRLNLDGYGFNTHQ